MNTEFSVVIPLYNKAAYISRAIRSVLSQTFQGFEVLVVDDCSTDNGVEIVKAFHDPRIRIIQHEKNRGVSAARNRGIAESTCDWITFLDADDEWKAGYLEAIVGLQQKYPDCDAYASCFEYRYENSDRVHFPANKQLPRFWNGILEDYFALSASGIIFYTGSITVSRRALLKCGGFMEGISHGEDLIMWALVALRFRIAYTRESFLYYYQGIPNQLTKSVADFRGEALEVLVNEYKNGNVPEKYQKSFLDYLFRRTILVSRVFILDKQNGKEARRILRQNPKKSLRWRDYIQFFWMYFWSFAPGIFRKFVFLKENMKNVASISNQR